MQKKAEKETRGTKKFLRHRKQKGKEKCHIDVTKCKWIEQPNQNTKIIILRKNNNIQLHAIYRSYTLDVMI